MSLSREEKERLLKALEADRELRYALMGLLGFREVLDRITRLEEGQRRIEERILKLEEGYQELGRRFARLEERVARLEERFVELAERVTRLEERVLKLEERVARLEERFADLEERFLKLEERVLKLEERLARLEERVTRLEERFAQLEERFAQLEERFARLEERFLKLEERYQKLEERVTRLESEMVEFKRLVVVIAHRFGVLTESAFREAMKYVVEETLGVARVERVVLRDEEGIVYGSRAQVEVDVAVVDGVHVLVEVKSRVSRGDVAEMRRIGDLYERVRGVRPRLVIVGGLIDADAWELAARLGVEIRPAIRDATLPSGGGML